MKKSIKVLVEKLTENEKGQLIGGFGSIKGGFNSLDNQLLANSGCSNPGDCRLTDNSGCSNTGTC